MNTIGSPLYFFSIGLFSLLFVYQFFIWLGRREELINLAFSVLSLSYIGVITLSRMDFLRQHTVRHILPISITIIISVVIPFIGYVFLSIHELKNFFFYSSLSVVLCSLFMIIHYLFLDISIPLTAVYYAFVAIWPTLGTVLVFYHFIRKKQYKDRYNTALFIGYLIIMLSLVAQLIPTILNLGMGNGFLMVQTFPLVAVILLLSVLSSKRFNREHQELIKLKISLEKKVEERTWALKEADRQKTDFFINFAHEMKTPLLLVQNYLQRHIRQEGNSGDLDVVNENVENLTRSMTNFLDFEKLDKNMPLYDHQLVTDASEMIERKMEVYKLPVKQAGLSATIKNQSGCFIRIDPIALDRIFNNLIDNAIRYNKPGGSISVKLESTGDMVIFTIADTGIGILEENLMQIFQPYQQLSNKKRNLQGIGVGLNIVKRIIDDVDGKINVESTENQETRFILSFNKAPEAASGEAPEVALPLRSCGRLIELEQSLFKEDRKTIFIVEDNIQHLAFLQSSLEDEYNIFFAVNGRTALRKLPEIPVPDVVLCDVMMDEMDGFDCFRELSASEEYSGIPFIFISALTGEEEKMRGLASGAIDFISKPYSIEELKNKIKSIIRLDEVREKQQLSKIEKRIIGALHEETVKEARSSRLQENCSRHKLSPREIEIVNLILEGYEHKEIGYRLEMKLNTLKTHIKNIYSKCNVQNKVELVNKIRQ